MSTALETTPNISTITDNEPIYPIKSALTIEINDVLYHIHLQKFQNSTTVYLALCLNNIVSFCNFYNAVPSRFDDSTVVVEILQHNGTSQLMEEMTKALCFVTKKPLSLLTDIDVIDTFDATMIKNKLIVELKGMGNN